MDYRLIIFVILAFVVYQMSKGKKAEDSGGSIIAPYEVDIPNEPIKPIGGFPGFNWSEYPVKVGLASIATFFGVVAEALAGWARGDNSYQAAAREAMMRPYDMTDIAFVKILFDYMGVSEPQAWPMRKELISTPLFLKEQYLKFTAMLERERITPSLIVDAYERMQAHVNDWLESLKTLTTKWGTRDFYTPLMQWVSYGNGSALNAAYVELFSQSEYLTPAIPDWKNIVLI